MVDPDISSVRRMRPARVVALVGLLLLITIIALGAILYVLGALNPLLERTNWDERVSVFLGLSQDPALFKETSLDLPPVIVTILEPGGQYQMRVNMRIVLATGHDAVLLQDHMPRVIDIINTYMREIRIDDLKEREGLSRLRQEILRHIAEALRPAEIRDVMFIDLDIQE